MVAQSGDTVRSRLKLFLDRDLSSGVTYREWFFETYPKVLERWRDHYREICNESCKQLCYASEGDFPHVSIEDGSFDRLFPTQQQGALSIPLKYAAYMTADRPDLSLVARISSMRRGYQYAQLTLTMMENDVLPALCELEEGVPLSPSHMSALKYMAGEQNGIHSPNFSTDNDQMESYWRITDKENKEFQAFFKELWEVAKKEATFAHRPYTGQRIRNGGTTHGR